MNFWTSMARDVNKGVRSQVSQRPTWIMSNEWWSLTQKAGTCWRLGELRLIRSVPPSINLRTASEGPFASDAKSNRAMPLAQWKSLIWQMTWGFVSLRSDWVHP